jgi:CRISPR/Cas system-associated endoribonuclease Cas2
MAVYIVTYDLNAPGQDYNPLISAIRKYTNCKCLKSAFFIDTSEDASVIRDKLTPLVDKNDALYVVELRKHWAANRTLPCNEWLRDQSRTWR